MVCVAVCTLSTQDVERHRWQCHPGVVGRSPVMRGPPSGAVSPACGGLPPEGYNSASEAEARPSRKAAPADRDLVPPFPTIAVNPATYT
ncbi:hypothetical protein EMIHUDRAFT_208866 [Emiliania huxleyi CCMP1516]|uniref:Uncharacterized protein n=2 Tax=Emiliania huxleyi TaxID=2903 RepID=A0A0D3J975_EMIH1|nr:hypothetical protein EMIHUDRAFT_208866 [Emiliania huxleyi CCMP1516]EOD20060.1 hypothetical protein EMIHUDRAFT_208866 [Emiliania huxleyi CCMP1516]|eukprot:XP_005772489.1 hypothetical protein EMIHUDRAFT_208866 [Emiliania huxleyi CCMP1516]